MKKLKFLAIATLAILSSCSTENIEDINKNDNNEFVIDNSSSKVSGTGTVNDPIVIGSDRFVETVGYSLKYCGSNGSSTSVYKRRRSNFYQSSFQAGVGFFEFQYQLNPVTNCVSSSNLPNVIEYNFGPYYKVFGKVARLVKSSESVRPGDSDFWTIDTSNPTVLQKIFFKEDGSFTLGETIGNPFNSNTKLCDGIATFNSGRTYIEGDRVVYRNQLFQRVYSFSSGKLVWRKIGNCN